MDPLVDFLDGPRARSAFILRVLMSPPWSIDASDQAALTLVGVLGGSAWVARGNEDPVLLERGDTLVVRGDEPYRLSSAPGLRPTVFIGPGQACTGPDGRDLSDEMSAGVRTWGNDARGEDSLVVGSFRSAGEVGNLLLAALPEDFVVRGRENPMLAMLATEISGNGLAQSSVLDRLLDLALIRAVRAWAESAGPTAPDWLLGRRDEDVRRVLALIHNSPERDWSVQGLAAEVSMSRASLARRFAASVGMPPIAYLTQWRLALAADMVADRVLTLDAIAGRVGYSSAFSLSSAFKKHYGVSPQAFRGR